MNKYKNEESIIKVMVKTTSQIIFFIGMIYLTFTFIAII
jgi:hypothetical protein